MERNVSATIHVKNSSTKKNLENVIHAIQGFRIQKPGDSSKTDLLIYELSEDVEKDFQFIQYMLSSDLAEEVFLTSPDPHPDVLMRAMRIGAKEFLAQPLKEEEVHQALDRFLSRHNGENDKTPVKLGQIISIIGSKGGVGTTTVAVNLAVSLADKESVDKIALVDMNMLFGEIPVFMDIKPKYHWGEIARNIDRLDATYLTNILSVHSSGVSVLPSPCYLSMHRAVTPELMERILRLMQRMFDFVVIDGGHSIGDTLLKTLSMSTKVLLVSNLSLPCLSNASLILKSFNDNRILSHDRVKVVVNRYLKSSEISLKNAEESLNKEMFWKIPNDYPTSISAINQGLTLSQVSPKAKITSNIQHLADVFVNGQNSNNSQNGKQGKRLMQWRFLKDKFKKQLKYI